MPDIASVIPVTNIALGWFFKKVDIEPYNSRSTQCYRYISIALHLWVSQRERQWKWRFLKPVEPGFQSRSNPGLHSLFDWNGFRVYINFGKARIEDWVAYMSIDSVSIKRLWISWFPRLRFCRRSRNLEFMITITISVWTSVRFRPYVCLYLYVGPSACLYACPSVLMYACPSFSLPRSFRHCRTVLNVAQWEFL